MKATVLVQYTHLMSETAPELAKTTNNHVRPQRKDLLMTDRFLPDLGSSIQCRTGTAAVRVAGTMDLEVIDRYLNEYLSLSGAGSVGGVGYYSTFDFGNGTWPEVRRLLQENFYLDISGWAPERHTAMQCAPPLAVAIDFEVTPKESTQSQKANELFTPLNVTRVHRLDLVPTSEVLMKRHAWWVQQSRTWCGTVEPSVAMAWSALIHPTRTEVRDLDYTEFIGNMAGCNLACHGPEAVNQTIERLVRHGFVRMPNRSPRPKIISGLLRKSSTDVKTCRFSLLNLLIWYSAGRILAHSDRGSIESDLAGIWSFGEGGIEALVSESRYCLARRDHPSLRNDEIERELTGLAQQHAGIRAILDSRVAAFPNDVWDHPEVSRVLRRYVMYDVLRQVYRTKGAGLVSPQIAERCEQNVQMIVRWFRQCAPVEIAPVSLGIRAM